MMETQHVGDLILLRGLPGSGKTTLASVILSTPTRSELADIISADDFFINEEGKYVFDATRLKAAHNDCQVRCAERMKMGVSKIVVANTFTQVWEMEPYFTMAKRYHYRVHSIIVENRHGGINVHGVDEAKMHQMHARFEIQL